MNTRKLLAGLGLISLLPGTALAQEKSSTAVLVLAHGAGPAWNAGVLQAVDEVRKSMPSEAAFLMGPDAPRYRFQDQILKLQRSGADTIVIVPLLVSSHSGHFEQIRWLARETDSLDPVMQHHLHMAGIERPSATATLRVARALDDAPELAAILAERAKAMTPVPAERALVLVGHGPNSAEDYAAWMQNLRRVSDRVRELTGFREVVVELVRDDAPAPVRAEAVTRTRELVSMQARMTGKDVIVVPILIGRSSVGDERIKRDLAGLPIVYTGDPILPHPLIAQWIVSRVQPATAATR